MRVVVRFGDESLEVEVDGDRLIAAFGGPEGVPVDRWLGQVRRGLESPRDFPPLHRAVVPGDRVALAVDARTPSAGRVVALLADLLVGASVDERAIGALVTGPLTAEQAEGWPEGVARIDHEPGDDASIAYLASTAAGRRVYLHRLLTDADVVLSVGPVGYDEVLGYRGPWSTLFPDASNAKTRAAFRGRRALAESAGAGHRGALLDESAEVTWLLGSLYHVGVLPGAGGAVEAIAGHEPVVREAGMAALDRAWGVGAGEHADLVVAGIGHPGPSDELDALTRGIARAAGFARRGGKVAALSRIGGELGPAMSRLADCDDPAVGGLRALRGMDDAPDFLPARRLAEALARADVYLLGALDHDLVDDLGMIPLDAPAEAARLAAKSPSVTLLSPAEGVRPASFPE